MFQKNEMVTVAIEDIGSGGEGIGKTEGFTLFVKDAVPGDIVRARIVKNKKNYAYARLEKVLEPSPFRVEPQCAFYRQCGGCQLQALSYEKQLAYKQEKIRNSLIRIGGFSEEYIDRRMEPIVGMKTDTCSGSVREGEVGKCSGPVREEEAVSGELAGFRYRNKALYPIGRDKNGNVVAGFYAGRTHTIISNTSCWLGAEENEEILNCILNYMKEKRVSAYEEETGKGLVRHVLIRKGFASGELMVCLVLNLPKGQGGKRESREGNQEVRREGREGNQEVCRESREGNLEVCREGREGNPEVCRESRSGKGVFLPDQEVLTARLAAIKGMTSVSVSINNRRTNVIMGEEVYTIWGRGTISDTIHTRDMKREGYPCTGRELTFQISPLSFYQVNPVQTEKLYSLVLEYAGLTGRETVWDLYCGIGTISLFLAGSAGKVLGVEMIPDAVRDARENAKRNGIENAEFFVGRAEDILQKSYEEGGEEDAEIQKMPHPDVIVVDPPRKGCDEACLETMLRMAPEKIVYVSCDPATLARDLRVLCDGGYEVERIRGTDMFGMTVHVETVCLLSNLKCASNEPKPELAPSLGECRDTAQRVVRKLDTHVKLSLSMDDYYRIKEQGKDNQ